MPGAPKAEEEAKEVVGAVRAEVAGEEVAVAGEEVAVAGVAMVAGEAVVAATARATTSTRVMERDGVEECGESGLKKPAAFSATQSSFADSAYRSQEQSGIPG